MSSPKLQLPQKHVIAVDIWDLEQSQFTPAGAIVFLLLVHVAFLVCTIACAALEGVTSSVAWKE